MSEVAEARKLSHAAVGYEHPSQHRPQRCGGCRHYIRATPPRCEHVKSPIRMIDWCRKFEAKEKA
jgi:hypothetical protein